MFNSDSIHFGKWVYSSQIQCAKWEVSNKVRVIQVGLNSVDSGKHGGLKLIAIVNVYAPTSTTAFTLKGLRLRSMTSENTVRCSRSGHRSESLK
ncbi:hypothetical protein PoB_007680200 [Plakobranchus ocellatus]|uniref:Uncharacterized protein n=1 Tax=Plakobranchus ocellatus TaxID=259542 RepID=A0AAV4E137_9GAST|nr:hypothetical protein PoB_007680200 [Plakobranchus ocellatus]